MILDWPRFCDSLRFCRSAAKWESFWWTSQLTGSGAKSVQPVPFSVEAVCGGEPGTESKGKAYSQIDLNPSLGWLFFERIWIFDTLLICGSDRPTKQCCISGTPILVWWDGVNKHSLLTRLKSPISLIFPKTEATPPLEFRFTAVWSPVLWEHGRIHLQLIHSECQCTEFSLYIFMWIYLYIFHVNNSFEISPV